MRVYAFCIIYLLFILLKKNNGINALCIARNMGRENKGSVFHLTTCILKFRPLRRMEFFNLFHPGQPFLPIFLLSPPLFTPLSDFLIHTG